MGDELHKLFLFEFMVHSVTFSNSTLKLDRDFLKKLGPTCVQFKAKNFPTLTVTEIDFCAKDSFNSNIVKFKSGKSCLFALGSGRLEDCEIAGEVVVKRPLPEGCTSNSYCVGKSTVCLNNKFINVLNSAGNAPSSQCMKTSLDLKNSINETVGVARLLLRLTCFGTAIMTEFQKTVDDSKGFLFKGDKIVAMEPEASNCGGGRKIGVQSQATVRKNSQPPFGFPPQSAFGMLPPQQTPYGGPQGNSYGGPQNNPYCGPQNNPYGGPQNNPYGSPQNNPYTMPQNAPYPMPCPPPLEAMQMQQGRMSQQPQMMPTVQMPFNFQNCNPAMPS